MVSSKHRTPQHKTQNAHHNGAQTRMATALVRFCLLVMLFLPALALAQDIKVTARVDSNNIMIGDWLGLHFEVLHRDTITVNWPLFADSLEGIEVVKRGEVQIQKNGTDVLEKADFIITSFDSGTVVVPPFQFYYTSAGDTAKKLAESSPLPIFVHTVDVDTSQDIKDIKPPLTLPITFAELLPYILILLGIGALGWLFYYVWNKRRKGESILPPAPKRPAHEVALEALRSLESENLWQRGKIKEHYSALTDIVRTYIENRFNVKAMEMVTDEIMASSFITSLEKQTREPLRDLLVLADFVKFAKAIPSQQENESSINNAAKFVENTWRVPEQPEVPQQQQEAKA